LKLSELAKLIDGELTGDADIEILGVGKIESAASNEITFIANPAYEKYFTSTNAGAVIVSKSFQFQIIQSDEKSTDNNSYPALIKVDDPYLSFLKLLELFVPTTELQKIGQHKSAIISKTSRISPVGTGIGANCYIGDKCIIGKNTQILPNCVLMNDVEVGEDVIIYPNVTIYNGCKIGNNVIIHSGTIIGSDGFGQAKTKDGTYTKIPQKGIVVLEDNIEIGSNCTIDRATIGETRLCKGVKLDNQIQIAHNVYIGENTVIAAQVGVAGSTKIGKNCLIGGKVGMVGHIEICDNVMITAATNVSKSITKPGVYSGYRAQEQKQELKKEALVRGLENIKNRLDKLDRDKKKF